jgi:uncharacterized protein YgiM (DUF1202 family)
LFAAAAVWLWFVLATARQCRPALKPALKPYLVWVGLLAMCLVVCFSAALYTDRLSPRAIVVAQEAVARQAPLDESPSAFTLHDGAELQVLDQKDEWLQVKVDSRRIGWVRKDLVLTAPAG